MNPGTQACRLEERVGSWHPGAPSALETVAWGSYRGCKSGILDPALSLRKELTSELFEDGGVPWSTSAWLGVQRVVSYPSLAVRFLSQRVECPLYLVGVWNGLTYLLSNLTLPPGLC